jgi:hypothetical protein
VFTKLLGLQYKIIYKKGLENNAADALSRCPTSDKLMAISAVQPQWLEEIQSSYTSDPEATKLLSQLAVNPEGVSHYSLANGIIRYKGKIWLGHNKDLQGKVFHALHNSALGGHSGAPVTYH